MSIITPIPPRTPTYQRLFYGIPVIGWIARDVMFGSPDNRVWFAIILASVWLMSVAQWGVAVLLLPFVLAVPAAIVAIFSGMVWLHDRKASRTRGDTAP